MRSLLLTFFVLAGLASEGQTLIRAYSTTERMIEGGNVDVLMMDTSQQSYELNLPKGFGAQVRLDTSSVMFNSQSNLSIITVTLSTNFADGLPTNDVLQAQAQEKNPGASVLQSFRCVTGCGLGRGIDFVRVVAPGAALRMRDAYLPLPGGSVEFYLSCNSAEYDSQNRIYLRLLNSFRVRPGSAINKP